MKSFIKYTLTIILTSFYYIGQASTQIIIRVTDEKGEPLIGASVIWKNTQNGGLTDNNGKITLPKKDSTDTIITSFIGYNNDTTSVDTLKNITIRMKEVKEGYNLNEIEIAHNRKRRPTHGAMMVEVVTSSELMRAACCNLGESFTTNPSVDVNYNDAATGAKQIKLLGLSGTYVQMLTENIPNFRGIASPFALNYIPGPWMSSIQVSKGSATVKNGHESITGQINVEYLKPQTDEEANFNIFMSSHTKWEINADANYHLNKRLSTAVLAHYEDIINASDMNNDGMLDKPDVRQWNVMNRWMYKKDRYIMQSGFKALNEKRNGGETKRTILRPTDSLYTIDINAKRYELFSKNAFILNYEHNANIAMILSGSFHDQDAKYGLRTYDADERNGYIALLFETEFTKKHSLSTGYNLMYDNFDQKHNIFTINTFNFSDDKELTNGIYAQYTFNNNEKIVAVAGLRADHSSEHGIFITPRCNIKWAPYENFSTRIAAGKGYRTPRPLAENNYLLASSRKWIIPQELKQEEAWNSGISMTKSININKSKLVLNADYFYTHFQNQTVIDMDYDPHSILFYNLDGKAYSHTFQIDASYHFIENLSITAAFRVNNAKTTYNKKVRERPLTSRYKGLLTANYKTPLELWQFDMTCQLNGPGRMPDPYIDETGKQSWNKEYDAYPQLSAQLTRIFRWGSIYAGGENLTNFKQKNPIIDSENPWGGKFDASMAWGPTDGAMIYIGARLKINIAKKIKTDN